MKNIYSTASLALLLAMTVVGSNLQRAQSDDQSTAKPNVASSNDAYSKDLQRRVKRAWFPPKGNETTPVTITFKVHSGGDISDLRVTKSSGIQAAERAAMKAVENATPFRPLPTSLGDVIEVDFPFDYRVFAGGGGGSRFDSSPTIRQQ